MGRQRPPGTPSGEEFASERSDLEVTRELHAYKGLHPRWHDWTQVCDVLADVALHMAGGHGDED